MWTIAIIIAAVTPVSVQVDDAARAAGYSGFTVRVFAPWKVSQWSEFGRLKEGSQYLSETGFLSIRSAERSDGMVMAQTRRPSEAQIARFRSDWKRRVENLRRQKSENRSRWELRKLPWEEEFVSVSYLTPSGGSEMTRDIVAIVNLSRLSSRGEISGSAMIYGDNGDEQIEAFLRTVRSVNYQR